MNSSYAGCEPIGVEAPFELVFDGLLVRGRIDAVYERQGKVELVDFKTGLPPVPGDGGAMVQLDLYALAAVDTWGTDPERLLTTNCYLGAGTTPQLETRSWDRRRIDEVRAALGVWVRGVADRRFEARPGDWCRRCEFLPYCRPGQAAVE